jgi:transcriptional regulator with GAF, ATPase, and Fis domain
MIWTEYRGGHGKAVFTDAQLIEAMGKHVTQAAAARALGVTRVAVCKRLKRLMKKWASPSPTAF